jgi:hypothetical protein
LLLPPKKLYIQQDQYNEREQALMKISIQQRLEDTIEKNTTTLLESNLTDDPTKLMGASIDSKLSRIDEELKKRLQSLESRIEKNTNKRFKRIEDLIANIAPNSTQDPKARGGAHRGAPQKKSTHPRNTPPLSNRSWTRNGQGNGPGWTHPTNTENSYLQRCAKLNKYGRLFTGDPVASTVEAGRPGK